jgi:hypothetical protein
MFWCPRQQVIRTEFRCKAIDLGKLLEFILSASEKALQVEKADLSAGLYLFIVHAHRFWHDVQGLWDLIHFIGSDRGAELKLGWIVVLRKPIVGGLIA